VADEPPDSEPRRALQACSDAEAPAAACAVTALAVYAGNRRAGLHAASHAGCMLQASAAPSHPVSCALNL